MADERWDRMWDIFHAAIEREPGDRIAFIESACSDDRERRREIEGLLQSHSRTGGYLEHNSYLSAVVSVAALEAMIGQIIDNRNRIRSVVGVGGMGAVRNRTNQPSSTPRPS